MMTTADEIRAMTPDQRRDWLAEQDGWIRPCTPIPSLGGKHLDAWSRFDGDTFLSLSRGDHPHPATLDGAAKALPEGWRWTRQIQQDHSIVWIATNRERGRSVIVDDTGNERNDRYLLACLARVAEMEAK